MNNDNQNFFDTRTLIAVLLIGFVFLGWQHYMQTKYPESYRRKSEATKDATAPALAGVDAKQDTASVPAAATEKKLDAKPVAVPMFTEEKITFTHSNLSFDISSAGMGLSQIRIGQFRNRSGDVIELGPRASDGAGRENGKSSLETRVRGIDQPLEFKVSKVNELMYVGRAQFGSVEIVKTYEIDPTRYLLKQKIAISGQDPRFTGLTNYLLETIEPVESGSWFAPVEKQEFFIDSKQGRERIAFTNENLIQAFAGGELASVGSQYFAQSVLDSSPIVPEIKVSLNHQANVATIELDYHVLNSGTALELESLSVLGPKSFTMLREIDPRLARIVDFGFFDFIGRYILTMLKWFYSWVGNWGVAIILLTVVVRILVLPFNLYSYKSMKALQGVQPKLQAVKEKFKDDQVKQNQEVMKIMRESGANPLGGCLPVLLQFPIFLALYQVLGHSIELYQAPFALWIHDLSFKDPLYILPVLMGITMYIQFKITPSTMDPAQAKMLLFMPILFTAFMLGLPSGLTLYMLVGAIFSVGQQMYFTRGTAKPAAAKAQLA